MPFLLTVLYIFALGIIAHYVGEALPRKIFNCNKFPFKPFYFEKGGKIYEAIHIRKWKDKVPDMSKVMHDMIPKKISFNANSKELYRLAKETCVAESVHNVLGVLFIAIYFFWKNTVGIFITAISILLNLPFILIQRYNRPKIIALADRLYEKECELNANSDTVLQHGTRS